jgi:hypothetical protein
VYFWHVAMSAGAAVAQHVALRHFGRSAACDAPHETKWARHTQPSRNPFESRQWLMQPFRFAAPSQTYRHCMSECVPRKELITWHCIWCGPFSAIPSPLYPSLNTVFVRTGVVLWIDIYNQHPVKPTARFRSRSSIGPRLRRFRPRTETTML